MKTLQLATAYSQQQKSTILGNHGSMKLSSCGHFARVITNRGRRGRQMLQRSD